MSKSKGKKPTKSPAKPIKPKAVSPMVWLLDQRKTIWLTAGMITCIGIIVFWRYVSGQFLYLFEDIGSDTITVFYPNIVHLAHYYKQVGFPGWSFFLGPGQGIYPGGLLNPWDWIYLPMDAKMIAQSIGFVQLIKLILSGVVFALFLRKIGVEKPVILIGAIMYAFGGYLVVGSGWYIHSTHIFWMTVAFLGFEMLLRDQKWWLFPIPFIFLAGTRSYFLVLFMLVYGTIRTLDYYNGDWKKVLHIYGRMAICGLLALMLTAPFLGAKFSKLVNSPRVTGKVSKVELLSDQPVFGPGTGKHNPTAVLRWFSNDVIGTGDDYKGYKNYLEGPLFYIGLLSLLLLPQFFLLADKRQRWLYAGFLFFWLWLILFPWFRYAFYAFAGNYYKGALSLFIPFSVLLVALLALDKIMKGRQVNLLVLAVTLLLSLIALWYPYEGLPEGIQVNIQSMVSVFLILEAIALAGFNFNGLRKFVLPVLIGLVAIEACLFSSISNSKRLAVPGEDLDKPLRHFDQTNDAIAYIKSQDNEMFYRTEKLYGSVKTGYNDALVQGYFSTKMYQSHNSKHYVAFLEEMGVIPKGNEASSRWLVGVARRNFYHPLFSIKYLLSKSDTHADLNLDIYEKVNDTGPVEIYKNKYFIPFGIPFDQYFIESEFLKLNSGQKPQAIYHGIVIPDAQVNQVQDMPKGNTADIRYGSKFDEKLIELQGKAMKMTSFNHNQIKGTINLEKPSVLFFSLAYDDAWHVFVDGVEQNLMLVDIGFSGVKVGQGSHEIELKYIPPMSRTGWLIFIPGLAIYLFLAIKGIRLFPIRS